MGNVTPVTSSELAFGDYQRFSQVLLEYCGLDFSGRRQTELALGVRHAFAASTCGDLNAYYALLRDPVAGRVELDRLVNAVTVNESHFFRDEAQFDALYYHVLPLIIERKRPLRTLRIWSAGCASGEEPFSIAILLRELLPDIDEWAITILGTDINTEALSRARKGIYGDWAFREERAKMWRPIYFRPTGNRFELQPEVQRMVTFAWLNLADASYPSYETNTMLMDLILCRNVTIYFNPAVTQLVADRLYDGLLDGGWLVVGHSEPSLSTYRRFRPCNFTNAVLYQRGDAPTAQPFDWDSLSALDASWAPLSDTGAVADPLLMPHILTQPDGDGKSLPKTVEEKGVGSVDQARELLEYGYSEQARDLLLTLSETATEPAQVAALLGRAYANLGQWQEAERWCRRAVRFDNLLLEAYYTLALVMQHQGALDEAIGALKKVIYVDRNHILGHFGLADLYHRSGQLAQSLKSLDNAYRLLERYAEDQVVPDSGGIIAGRLKETVIRQQQQWGVEGGRLLVASGQR